MNPVRELAQRDAAAWRAATTSPFLDGARSGELPTAAFDRWLEQDRLFVEALARAWARLLVGAPAEDLPLLSDGIAAFTAEMMWFQDLAAERGLAIPAPALPPTAAYCTDLQRLAAAPYPVALAAMWAVEAAYLEAWRSALPGAPAYRDFVAHWTDDTFAGFVGRLEGAADRALAGASQSERTEAGDAVGLIAEREAAFWAMTWTG